MYPFFHPFLSYSFSGSFLDNCVIQVIVDSLLHYTPDFSNKLEAQSKNIIFKDSGSNSPQKNQSIGVKCKEMDYINICLLEYNSYFYFDFSIETSLVYE